MFRIITKQTNVFLPESFDSEEKAKNFWVNLENNSKFQITKIVSLDEYVSKKKKIRAKKEKTTGIKRAKASTMYPIKKNPIFGPYYPGLKALRNGWKPENSLTLAFD